MGLISSANTLWFATRIRRLEQRAINVSNIVNTFNRRDKEQVENVERELNTSLATLKLLCDYAETHEVMSKEEHQIAQRIHELLEKARYVLEERKLSWWHKVIKQITNLLPMLGKLIRHLTAYLIPTNPHMTIAASAISGFIGLLSPQSNGKMAKTSYE